MTKAKTGWLLLGILCLASCAVAQDTAWEKYLLAGQKAKEQGQYAEAEKQFLADAAAGNLHSHHLALPQENPIHACTNFRSNRVPPKCAKPNPFGAEVVRG